MNFTRLLAPVLTILPALAVADRPLIVAHRGSSYTAPENTVAAAKLAWEHKSDALEVDIHLSKDNRVMVNHDDTTTRTAGGAPLTVSETTAEELRQLDVGSFKHARYKGEKIPFLEEVLETVPDGKLIFIEFKSTEETVPHVREILRKWSKEQQAVIIGFDMDTMIAAKKAMPAIPVYWLKSTEKEKGTKAHLPHDLELVQKVKENGLDGLDLQYQGVTKELVDAAHKAGLEFHVWTVDDPEAAVRLRDMGVDSITTNRPDLIRKVLFPAPND